MLSRRQAVLLVRYLLQLRTPYGVCNLPPIQGAH